VLSVLRPDSFVEEVLWILCGSYHHASTSITILSFLSPRSVYPSCCFHCSDGGPKSKRYPCDRFKHVHGACYTGLLHYQC
jgi:hypothetical protein